MARPLIVANCSGFYGDRLAAAREMVDGGPIDVLTGDYLAELTMLLLAKTQARGGPGYARTFLRQMEDVLATCIERGIKVVSNAGGLEPARLADDLRLLAERLGLSCSVAHVEGDDLLDRLDLLEGATNLDTGEPFSALPGAARSANAYLGGWGIAAALAAGADVVVTGRVTDASVVVGPAAWWHGWERDDWDRLAGAVAVGHILECGAQATGGNYSSFLEVPGLEHPGLPLAEIADDGSAVITKHPGTGGLVSIGTVTAQLLYEVGDPAYLNPDVTARFDTVRLEQDGPDRVALSGTRGGPPPATSKVCVTCDGGYRNAMTFVLVGLDIEAKADLARRTILAGIDCERVDVELRRSDRPDPDDEWSASAQLVVTVGDQDERKVGRAFSSAAVEMALSSYPGFFTTSPPGGATEVGVHWPTLVATDLLRPVVVHGDGRREAVAPIAAGDPPPAPPAFTPGPAPAGATRRLPLGTIVDARSGDKGGHGNVGLWVRTPAGYDWLVTLDIADLLPAARGRVVRRHLFPNLLAVNWLIEGLLGRGVADSTRFDAQAKALGELIRCRSVDIPVALLPTP